MNMNSEKQNRTATLPSGILIRPTATGTAG